jgi:hypothetical protein
MKTLILLIVLLSPIVLFAQNLEIPRKEFSISFSDNEMVLSSGETKQVKIQVLKSRGYQKGKIKMGMSSWLPKGVTVTFDPDKGNFDISTATISVQTDAVPGEYNLILNATISYTTKGAILKLVIK